MRAWKDKLNKTFLAPLRASSSDSDRQQLTMFMYVSIQLTQVVRRTMHLYPGTGLVTVRARGLVK